MCLGPVPPPPREWDEAVREDWGRVWGMEGQLGPGSLVPTAQSLLAATSAPLKQAIASLGSRGLGLLLKLV